MKYGDRNQCKGLRQVQKCEAAYFHLFTVMPIPSVNVS